MSYLEWTMKFFAIDNLDLEPDLEAIGGRAQVLLTHRPFLEDLSQWRARHCPFRISDFSFSIFAKGISWRHLNDQCAMSYLEWTMKLFLKSNMNQELDFEGSGEGRRR